MFTDSLMKWLRRKVNPLHGGRRTRVSTQPTYQPCLEPLEARNLMDGGFANVLVNDPSADHPVTLVDSNGITIVLTRDTQSETTLVLGDKGRIVVAYNDSGSENYSTSQREDIGYAVSPNGGQVFLDKGTPPDGPYGYYSDPALARSARTGTIFLTPRMRATFVASKLFTLPPQPGGA